MKKPNIKKIVTAIGFITVFGLTILISGSIVRSLRTGIQIDKMVEDATKVYQKDKVESLLLLLDSDRYTLKEKDHAIWVLGNLEDGRALTKLESLVTNEDCNHAENVCQYNLKKAILKVKGKFTGSQQASQ
jgi:hypothetical protein